MSIFDDLEAEAAQRKKLELLEDASESLRDMVPQEWDHRFFAACAAMQGLLARGSDVRPQQIAEGAVSYADLLLKELDKELVP